MEINEPPFALLDMGDHEWRFQESDAMDETTGKFDELLERHQGQKELPGALRKFVKAHPDHIDGLHHYASCLGDAGKRLEALAFSQTAVATGLRALPATFAVGRDRLPTGWVQNRPFLRALHGLTSAQWAAGLRQAAISSGELCLALDPEDRMGARFSLISFHLDSARPKLALALFERERYRDMFHVFEYLRAFALITVGKEDEAKTVLRDCCLSSYPQVARFILEPDTARPANDGWGIAIGSEFEGWYYAQQFGFTWRTHERATAILVAETRAIAARNWGRFGKEG